MPARDFSPRYTQSSQGGGAANYFGNTPPCTTCLKAGNPAGSVSPRGGGSDLFIYPKNIVMGYTWSLTPSSLLDLRYSLNRQLLNRLPQSSGFLGFVDAWVAVFPGQFHLLRTIPPHYPFELQQSGQRVQR